MNLEEKLEELKQVGNYSILVYFGENVGCDDMDVPLKERNLQIITTPVGYLGSIKCLYKGTLQSFLDFDVTTVPLQISNPPLKSEYEKEGWYCWGASEFKK